MKTTIKKLLFMSLLFSAAKIVPAAEIKENSLMGKEGNDTELIKAIKKDKPLDSDIKQLIEKKADINARGKDCMTALMWASYRGQLAVVDYLLAEGANTEYVNKRGKSAADLSRTQEIDDTFAQYGVIKRLNIRSPRAEPHN